METQLDRERLDVNAIKSLAKNSRLVIFSLIAVLFAVVMAQWASTLSVFTVERVGFTTEQYGWLMALSGVLIVVFQHPVSRRLNWLGTRRALVLGFLFYGVGFLSFGWVRTVPAAAVSVVVIVIGEMLFAPTAMATVGRLSRPEDRGKSLGFFGLCSTIGIALGPLLGGFLLDEFPSSPLAVWGVVAAVALIGALAFTFWTDYLKGPAETG